MPIIRRDEQTLADRYPGVPRYTLSGIDTGAASLHIGDLTYLPGSEVPHHYHPGVAEETQFMVEGELECWLDGHRLTVRPGDCVLAQPGTSHAFFNRTGTSARMVTIFPITPPETVHTDNPPELKDAESHPRIIRAGSRVSESAGITRHELSGDFSGAKSTYVTMNILQPGAVISNHYHPDHESSMYCLSGQITATYGEDNDIKLAPGDIFTAEAMIRHGIRNTSDAPATMLAVHPVINPPARVDVD